MGSLNYNLKKEASKFREVNGFGANDPVRLKSLLLKLNVITVFEDLGSDFSGMALKAGKHRFMFINSGHSLGRQHFTICHELAHLFIQEDFDSMICKTGKFDKKDRIEHDADWFAAYFLMPEEGLLSMIPDEELKRNKIKLSTIVKVEQFFSCSRSALLFRLENLDLIDRDKYREYESNVRDSAKYFGYNEALYSSGNRGAVIGDYGRLAKDLFDLEVISESNYISLMQDIGVDFDNGVKME